MLGLFIKKAIPQDGFLFSRIFLINEPEQQQLNQQEQQQRLNQQEQRLNQQELPFEFR
jgi:hypothetical protein